MMHPHIDTLELVSRLKEADEAFVLATVVRTVSVTAAKAGAKAVIRSDGSISAGWIGGGCARAAVLKAAREALADGEPRLVSIQPELVLAELGVRPGEDRDGIRFARNMCPSKGTMDIFVEPMLPRPSLVVLGASPVALALVELAPHFGFSVTLAAPADERPTTPEADAVIDGFQLEAASGTRRFIVVSTQGRGDEAAVRSAATADAAYHAFVGSRRKMVAVRESLLADGLSLAALDRIKAPAGLDLGAITPEEIALSILAEMVMERRRGRRESAEAKE